MPWIKPSPGRPRGLDFDTLRAIARPDTPVPLPAEPYEPYVHREPVGPWSHWARCRTLEPTVFFPHDGPGTDAAKAICHTCPVEHRCLEHALTHQEHYGVWGGKSQRERARILRGRRKVNAA